MIDQYNDLLKEHSITHKEAAKVFGISYGGYRSMLSRKKNIKWVKAFMFGYKLGKLKK